MIMDVICREVNAIIVHESGHVNTFTEDFGVPRSKIHLIPHGAREVSPVPNAKETLGLENKKVILLGGYFRPTKGFDRIIDIFPKILEQVPDACLVLAGKMRRMEYSSYRQLLFEKINNSPAKESIEVFRGQFPQKTFDTIISAADTMVFPYSAGAQSGVMSHALAFGKPIVASTLPAFTNIVAASEAGYTSESDEEYVNAIIKLLNDDKEYQRLSKNATNYVRNQISWRLVSDKHLEIYQQFEETLGCKTRYVYVG